MEGAIDTSATGCWLWTKGRDSDGYGRIQIRGRAQKAHRVMYEMTKGPIPAGLLVLHACDTPACVNPEHLRLGTNQDNIDDRNTRNRQAKGDRNGSRLHPEARPRGERMGHIMRSAACRGERHPKRRLSAADVLTIRSAFQSGSTSSGAHALGRAYGVSENAILDIVKGRTWKHVGVPS
jgi:hypothetical protein